MIFLVTEAAFYSTGKAWPFMDALYFTDYTLITIGIDNMAPKTRLREAC